MIKRLFLMALLASGVSLVSAVGQEQECCVVAPTCSVVDSDSKSVSAALIDDGVSVEFKHIYQEGATTEIVISVSNGRVNDYPFALKVKDELKVYNQSGELMPVKSAGFYDVTSIYKVNRVLKSCEPLELTIVVDKLDSVSKLVLRNAVLTNLK